jgi:putative tryptophan/tyrosine transport system substrate-binding protein
MQTQKSKIASIAIILSMMIVPWSHPAEAQQPKKIPRNGFVLGSDGSDPRFEAFRQGLRELGYNEGKNLLIEYRPAGGNLAHSSSRVAELMQLKVDVLASGDLLTIQAAKEATKTIPIVMVTQADPVAAGLIDSLRARAETSRGSPHFPAS